MQLRQQSPSVDAALRSEPINTFAWAAWIPIWGTCAAAVLRGSGPDNSSYPFTIISFVYLVLFIVGVATQAIPGLRLCRAVAYMVAVALVAFTGIVGQVVVHMLPAANATAPPNNFSAVVLVGFDSHGAWVPVVFDAALFVLTVAALVPLLVLRGESGERVLRKHGYLLTRQFTSVSGVGLVAVLSLALAAVSFPCALSFVNLVFLLVALFHWNCVFPKKFRDMHETFRSLTAPPPGGAMMAGENAADAEVNPTGDPLHELSFRRRDGLAGVGTLGEQVSPTVLALRKQWAAALPQSYFMLPSRAFALTVAMYNAFVLVACYVYVPRHRDDAAHSHFHAPSPFFQAVPWFHAFSRSTAETRDGSELGWLTASTHPHAHTHTHICTHTHTRTSAHTLTHSRRYQFLPMYYPSLFADGGAVLPATGGISANGTVEHSLMLAIGLLSRDQYADGGVAVCTHANAHTRTRVRARAVLLLLLLLSCSQQQQQQQKRAAFSSSYCDPYSYADFQQ
jgi:hypothetical protein